LHKKKHPQYHNIQVLIIDMIAAVWLNGNDDFMVRFYIGTAASALMLPMLLLRDISKLEMTSVFGVIVNIFVAIVIIVESTLQVVRHGTHPGVVWFGEAPGVLDFGTE
jgi:hypothetical protein